MSLCMPNDVAEKSLVLPTLVEERQETTDSLRRGLELTRLGSDSLMQ